MKKNNEYSKIENIDLAFRKLAEDSWKWDFMANRGLGVLSAQLNPDSEKEYTAMKELREKWRIFWKAHRKSGNEKERKELENELYEDLVKFKKQIDKIRGV